MRYNVKVKFSNDGHFSIKANEITLSIKSKPEHGKANIELVKRLSEYFDIDKDRIKIIAGLLSPKKIVEIGI